MSVLKPPDKNNAPVARAELQSYSTLKNAAAETIIGTISRIFGFAGLVYASKMFGATEDTDVIYYAMGISTAIVGFFGAVNGNIILPQVLIARRDTNEEDAWNLTCYAFTVCSLLLLGVMAVGYFCFVEGLAAISSFTRTAIEHVRDTALILVGALYAAYVSDLLTSVLRGYRNFLIPNIALTIGAASGFCMFIFAGQRLGPLSIALVFLTSWAVQAIIMWLVLLYHGKILRFRLARFQSESTVLKLLPPLFLNQLSAVIVLLYPNYVASGLEGGDFTALAYARRIFDLIPGLLILPVVTAMAPLLSDLVAKGKGPETGAQIQKVGALLLSCVIPISVFVLFHADLLVAVVFGSSKYSHMHQALTADAMRWYLLALMSLATNAVITRALVMTQDIRAAYISLIFAFAPAIGVPLFVSLSVHELGSVGVAAGYALYLILVHQMLGYTVWQKMFGGFGIGREFMAIARPAAFSVAAGVISVLLCGAIDGLKIVQLILAGAIFGIAYSGFHAILRTDEYKMVIEKLWRSREAS